MINKNRLQKSDKLIIAPQITTDWVRRRIMTMKSGKSHKAHAESKCVSRD